MGCRCAFPSAPPPGASPLSRNGVADAGLGDGLSPLGLLPSPALAAVAESGGPDLRRAEPSAFGVRRALKFKSKRSVHELEGAAACALGNGAANEPDGVVDLDGVVGGGNCRFGFVP